MTRISRENLPALAAAIEDPAIRALFTERFVNACDLYDELIDAACFQILTDAGLLRDGRVNRPASVLPRCAPALRFLFRKLQAAGFLVEDGSGFVCAGAEPGSVDALAKELETTEPGAAVGAEVVRTLVAEAPAFFQGEKTGEDILFALPRLPLWFRYFSNENLLYSINNTLGAEVLTRATPPGAEILEIGGGCGSAAELALKALGPRVSRYRFTELVPTFARRGERAARAAAAPGTALEAAKLDMTKPWADQGVVPGSFDVVYSVNCFHVAPDLDFVLTEARRALKKGGLVVVSECVRPTKSTEPVYVEFVFDFLESFTNVETDPVKRPTHGFLTPTAWRASFSAAGYASVEIVPDVDAIAEKYPRFVVGAVVARS